MSTQHPLSFVRRRSVLITLTFLVMLSNSVAAQQSNEQAEMKRLELQADELIIVGDPNGAAQAIGKAAMMAGILAKQEADETLQKLYTGTKSFFRTQENGYRSLAIFEQAGGQPPAPTSACQLLDLAKQHNTKAQDILSSIDMAITSNTTYLAKRYRTQSQEWAEIIKELKTDFACS